MVFQRLVQQLAVEENIHTSLLSPLINIICTPPYSHWLNFNVALYKCFCQIVALLDVDYLGISSALGLTTNFVGVD